MKIVRAQKERRASKGIIIADGVKFINSLECTVVSGFLTAAQPRAEQRKREHFIMGLLLFSLSLGADFEGGYFHSACILRRGGVIKYHTRQFR